MKTQKKTVFFRNALLIIICIFLASCWGDDDGQINQANVLKKHSDGGSLDTIKEIQKRLTGLKNNHRGMEMMKLSIQTFKLDAKMKTPFHPEDLVSDAAIVNVKDSVAKLFDPDLQPCPIPEKILKKLKKFKDDKQSWVPKELASLLNSMPDKALYLKGTGLTVVLHTVTLKHADNTTENLIIIGAPTFSSINIADYVSKASNNNFGYTLDCSGLMNAAIDGTATVPGDDIKAKAALSMDKKSSMFVGGGVVLSPLYAAYYGDASGIKISVQDRVAILTALAGTPGIADTDSIELIMSYEVIWASSAGEQGFNGSADFSSKGGLGVGIAQVSGSGDVSGTVSRSSSFGSFDTYVTGRQRLNAPAHVKLADIKSLIQQLGAH